MNYAKTHPILVGGLVYLWCFAFVADFLIETGWYRLFYLSVLPVSLAIVWGILYVGESIRIQLIRFHCLTPFYPGMDWVIAALLGVAFFGNIAIILTMIPVSHPIIYQLFFTITIIICAWRIQPGQLYRSMNRLSSTYHRQTFLRWIWIVPLIAFVLRGLTTFLLVNGTEQLHNTLPFAKLLFNGVNFNQYNLDNHFLLLGTYETFGVFIRAFVFNDFAYHIAGQQVTFLLTIGGMCLLLGTIPWILRRMPVVAAMLMFWPTALNFAPSDTIAFKPDWLGILAASVATIAFLRLWNSSPPSRQNTHMITIVKRKVTCWPAI